MKVILSALSTLAYSARIHGNPYEEAAPYQEASGHSHEEDSYYGPEDHPETRFNQGKGGHNAYEGDYYYGNRYHDDEKYHYSGEDKNHHDDEGDRVYYGGYDEPHHDYTEPRPEHHKYVKKTYNYEHTDYPTQHYDDDPNHIFNSPDPEFYHAVDDFNKWETIWNQDVYESRLHTEAEIMVSLEALRAALVYLE